MKGYIQLILVGFLALELGFILTMARHRTMPSRPKPIHVGIAPEMKPIAQEYIDRAAREGIVFKNKVSAGFTDINQGRTIGICWYGKNFREVDIDHRFWLQASETSRKTLLFHELTHCFCTRAHDWAEGKKYPEVFIQDILDTLHLNRDDGKRPKPGFFMDDCPVTIMNPVILDDDCIDDHFDHYMKEMFERCQTW